MDRWVINASPLICLAKAGHADLLVKMPDEITVPAAVTEEVLTKATGDPAQAV